MSVLIVDTGCANLSSVAFAFERLGIPAKISQNAQEIKSADHVLLPGVGSAPFAMKALKDRGLIETLQSLTQPVLGICLGMQILFNKLTEGNQVTKGLCLIADDISELDTGDLPSPHMGWNRLSVIADDPLLDSVGDGEHAYFVHSYCAPVSDYTLASCEYRQSFSAIVRHNNVWGCQFHPERSSELGATILKNFSEIKL